MFEICSKDVPYHRNIIQIEALINICVVDEVEHKIHHSRARFVVVWGTAYWGAQGLSSWCIVCCHKINNPQNHHKWIQMGCINHPTMAKMVNLILLGLPHYILLLYLCSTLRSHDNWASKLRIGGSAKSFVHGYFHQCYHAMAIHCLNCLPTPCRRGAKLEKKGAKLDNKSARLEREGTRLKKKVVRQGPRVTKKYVKVQNIGYKVFLKMEGGAVVAKYGGFLKWGYPQIIHLILGCSVK